MNPDFRDILSAFCDHGVEFLIIGAYALAAHGYPRATGDIDLWIRCTEDNSTRAWKALEEFGAPLFDLTINDLRTPGTVFQMGVPPRRIDLVTRITGVDFVDAWHDRLLVEIEGLKLPVLGREHLVINKRASGRPKDLMDLAWLEGQGDSDKPAGR